MKSLPHVLGIRFLVATVAAVVLLGRPALSAEAPAGSRIDQKFSQAIQNFQEAQQTKQRYLEEVGVQRDMLQYGWASAGAFYNRTTPIVRRPAKEIADDHAVLATAKNLLAEVRPAEFGFSLHGIAFEPDFAKALGYMTTFAARYPGRETTEESADRLIASKLLLLTRPEYYFKLQDGWPPGDEEARWQRGILAYPPPPSPFPDCLPKKK